MGGVGGRTGRPITCGDALWRGRAAGSVAEQVRIRHVASAAQVIPIGTAVAATVGRVGRHRVAYEVAVDPHERVRMQAARGRAGRAGSVVDSDHARPTDDPEWAVPLRRQRATRGGTVEISLAGGANRVRPIGLDEMVVDESSISEIPERIRSAGMVGAVQSAAQQDAAIASDVAEEPICASRRA